jgi:hypothetical protein
MYYNRQELLPFFLHIEIHFVPKDKLWWLFMERKEGRSSCVQCLVICYLLTVETHPEFNGNSTMLQLFCSISGWLANMAAMPVHQFLSSPTALPCLVCQWRNSRLEYLLVLYEALRKLILGFSLANSRSLTSELLHHIYRFRTSMKISKIPSARP